MKTIKQITDNAHIKWLSKARTIDKNTSTEMTVLPYGYLGTAIEEALTSLLDSIKSEIRTEDSIKEGSMSDTWDNGYLSCRKEAINIINSHK